MKPGRMALAAAAALIVAAGGWYLGSPWWTLWRMREAARAGDLAALASYVDGPAVREQARREFRAAWESVKAGVRTDTPAGRRVVDLARRQLETAAPGGSVRVRDLQPWLASIPIRLAGGGGDPNYRPYLVRHGLDAFELRDEGASLENGPVLTFRRHGLGWKLAGVRWGQQ
ncbi:MAG TPA: DUF2939 domain-containing protein [Allosphingosinicella sp.]|nr:DUF2939 domain-containing protein [Allosphingosinicella sp.]